MRSLYVPAFALLLVLAGCLATINSTPTPATPREQLAAMEITYQESLLTIQDLVATGVLRGEAAGRVLIAVEAARTALRQARAGVDGPTGQVLLAAVNDALVGLATRLREEGQ